NAAHRLEQHGRVRIAGEDRATLLVLEQKGDAAAIRFFLVGLELFVQQFPDVECARAENVGCTTAALLRRDRIAVPVEHACFRQLATPGGDQRVQLCAIRREQRDYEAALQTNLARPAIDD